jgi:UrcA family protein
MSNPIQTLMNGAACAFAAVGLMIAAPIHAQPYGDRGDYDARSASVGEVVVTSPRRAEWDSETRSFVDRDYLTRVVDTSDLDLNTDWGARELRARVVRAAHSVCDRLSERDGPDENQDRACVHRAVTGALRTIPASYAFMSRDDRADGYDTSY